VSKVNTFLAHILQVAAYSWGGELLAGLQFQVIHVICGEACIASAEVLVSAQPKKIWMAK